MRIDVQMKVRVMCVYTHTLVKELLTKPMSQYLSAPKSWENVKMLFVYSIINKRMQKNTVYWLGNVLYAGGINS